LTISLNDKYAKEKTRAYLTGVEALVRLPILQHQRDIAAGLNTAGYVSGYRGSPLGTVDLSMWKAKTWLDNHEILFKPGVNEDLAATAVWGTQQIHAVPGPKKDGVFGMWYGKGPGVDRSMDAIKHANLYGTSQHGGVLAVAGDDHACKSSSSAHQSEHMFIGAGIPILNPANVQEVLDYGIHAWSLSRFSGCWVALKAVTETMDSSMSVEIDPDRVQVQIPDDVIEPEGGLHARVGVPWLEQERLLYKFRLAAVHKYVRLNRLNRVVMDAPAAKFGIVSSGKAYADVMEALAQLGIDDNLAKDIGIRIYKVGVSWPLEPSGTLEFAAGLQEILVVEEKRNIIEDQIVKQLYPLAADQRPVVVGEFDEVGNELVSTLAELSPTMVARAIGIRVLKFHDRNDIRQRLERFDAREKRQSEASEGVMRRPHFCSGCPHNTSTRVPEDSIGMAGIGCHAMVKWMDRNTSSMTHMGGEGVSWVGMAPFTETEHVFQNIGDGTYFHSGILAIRAAVASGENITYKVLYNDAVAMTGGQQVDGPLNLKTLTKQLQAEGVKRLAVVSDDYPSAKKQLAGISDISIHDRREFDQVQLQFRRIKGATAIVYDQTCAAEKRRRRRRGVIPESPKRVFINPDICEGCGDCGTKSNCLSILPKSTEPGIKRQIDQSACNNDFSCLEGFCPSFVTVTGAELRALSGTASGEQDTVLPDPEFPDIDEPWNILVSGIGGTGVLTVSSVLAMAAHLDGIGCTTLNQTGLAQKFGAVSSHVRIAKKQDDIHAVRIPESQSNLLLGCDLLVSAMPATLARLNKDSSHAIVNTYESPTADFIYDKQYAFPGADLQETIREHTATDQTHLVNTTQIARNLMGNSIGSNMFLLGYAYQRGLIPVSQESIFEAIELNNVAVDFNQSAFIWGRRGAIDLNAVLHQAAVDDKPDAVLTDLDDIIQWRYEYLVKYQNKRYADRYRALVERTRKFERQHLSANDQHGTERLTEAVARSYFKLLSYKDEYEVARLYSDGNFARQLEKQFKGNYKINYHLSPPLFARKDPVTGHPYKYRFPGFMRTLFGLMARMKGLRGTSFDPFGYSSERKQERQLIRTFEKDLQDLEGLASAQNFDAVTAIAELPQEIKGFGHVKAANVRTYLAAREKLFDKLRRAE